MNINQAKPLKTEEILCDALSTLLQNHNHEDITEKNICDITQINRGVFYAYFTDKYDLQNYISNKKT